ncbi:Uncharacterised protein [Mycobacteroides abscessus subsp. abscessus]|nr:Uncharacterised protein [Mycobacteroides abscessus subsp. abscessus]
MVGLLPEPVVYIGEEIPGGLVPGPAQVVGQLTQRRQPLRKMGSNREST